MLHGLWVDAQDVPLAVAEADVVLAAAEADLVDEQRALRRLKDTNPR